MTLKKHDPKRKFRGFRLAMLGVASAALLGVWTLPVQAQSDAGSSVQEADFWTCVGLLLTDPQKQAELCGPGRDDVDGAEPLRGVLTPPPPPSEPPVCDNDQTPH